jgi:LPXTG-site transpeptidase (sortase) family protein
MLKRSCKLLIRHVFNVFIFGFLLFTPRLSFAFSDVFVDHDYYQDIDYLYQKGIVAGYSDFTFHPDNYVPRAEALAMIFKASGVDVGRYNDGGFNDVSDQDWFYPVINYAWTRGMINGYSDGSFRPRDNVNIAEGLKMVINVFFDQFSPPGYVEDPLLAVNDNDWFRDYFLFAKGKGLINKNKYYHPSPFLTRGELASILHRVLLIKEGEMTKINELNQKKLHEYRLFIPKLNIINVPINYVNDFTDYNKALDVLWDGVGNFRYQPGILGKIVIYGHSSYFRNQEIPYKYIFRYLDQLNPGDRIYINYLNQGFIYEVFNEAIVSPDQLEVLQSYGYEELVLFTCWPPETIDYRYVINAKRINTGD